MLFLTDFYHLNIRSFTKEVEKSRSRENMHRFCDNVINCLYYYNSVHHNKADKLKLVKSQKSTFFVLLHEWRCMLTRPPL